MATNGIGSRSSPYWGGDRRQTLARPGGSPTTALLVGAGLIVGLWALVNLVGGLSAPGAGTDMILLHALLDTGAAALAVVVAVLCVVRWRLVGEAAALWSGVALLVYGIVTLALTGVLPHVFDVGDAVVWLRPASRFVVMAFLAAAVVSPPVDGRLGLTRLLLFAVSATVVLAVAFQLIPGASQYLTGGADAHLGVPASGYGSLLVTVLWGALFAGFMLRGHRESRPLLSWLGLLLLGLALAELTRLLAAYNVDLWSAGAHLLRLTALAVAMAGATIELQRAFSLQSDHLMRTVVSARAAEARVRAERQEVEERAHEARNALTAIEGASQTLERYRDRLDADTRSSLMTALSAEIARLQRLVSAEKITADRVPFKVAESLAPVVTGARTHGAGVLVDIDDELTAFGRWADTAEVVQNLIENARRYAPGSPVVVRARRECDRVLVRVEDRGPGVAPEQREAIFRRGVRGKQGDGVAGSGLGLYVSARLMRDQGGDLRLEDRPGGGAVFVVDLPAEEDSAVETGGGGHVEGVSTALDERDEAPEVVEGDGPAAHPRRAERGGLR
ncbi:MAG TPA: HAMP domain-containing sensor histidine kinase [Egibacteraceae bacterium]|nr:HAMP domain-containing sensor histidine kinase [Egibacteraceae bacterium]